MRRASRSRRLSALRGAKSGGDSASGGVGSGLSAPGSGTSNQGTPSASSSAPSVNSNNSSGSGGVFTLMVHGPEFNSGEYVVVNPECFPGIEPLDLVELRQPERTHPRLIVQVSSLAPVRGKLQVSLLKELAAQFGLEAFQPVAVTKVDARSATVDYMEVTFKDQYLSSADIWRVKVALFGKCVYVGKTVECLGIRSQVEGLLAAGAEVFSGVIGDATKIIVRSRSSRLFWLVQMSAEMWEFAPDGELYYEKLINKLLRETIARWTAYSVSHSVTVIAFSRTFYDADQFPPGFDPQSPPFNMPCRQRCYDVDASGGVQPAAKQYAPTIHVDPHTGRYYEDFYKVIVLSYTGPDWSQMHAALKKEFATYHKTHRWRGPDEYLPAEYELCRGEDASRNYIPGDICGRPDADDVEKSEDTDETTQEEVADMIHSPQGEFVKWTRLPFGVPSRAIDGNILEAINVTLNILDKHHMDRDLNRTGQSIVMITAGCSIFNVQEQLAEVTQQRMMDNGVGMDMISLAAPPLHVVPLFIYRKQRYPVADRESEERSTHFDRPRKLLFSGIDKDVDVSEEGLPPPKGEALTESASFPPGREECRYQVPHWVNITFLDFDCKCSCGGPLRTPGTTPDRQDGAYSNRLFSHRAHSCQCQFRMNKQFLPLPSFRMFDISAPSEKVSPLPVALRNIIPGYPRRADSAKTKSIAQCLDEELRMGVTAQSPDQLLPLASSLNDAQQERQDKSAFTCDSISVFLPDEWRISRSPDYELSTSPTIKRATTNLSLSLITREALMEYDAEVFAPRSSTRSGLRMDLRGISNMSTGSISAVPSPGSPCLPTLEEAADDMTSKTFDGAMSNMFKADQRRSLSQSVKWAGSSTYRNRQSFQADGGRASGFQIGSILSPRDERRLSESSSTPLLQPLESNSGSRRYAVTDAVAISRQRPSDDSIASDPSHAYNSNKEMLPPSLSSPPQAILGKSFDSSQRMNSRLRAERKEVSTTANERLAKERGFQPARSESCHLGFSPAPSASSSHRSDQSSFRPLERAVTMTRVMGPSPGLAPTLPMRVATRTSQQLRMISPPKFTYTGMRRGQSEIFHPSVPSTATAGMAMSSHTRSVTPGNTGVTGSSDATGSDSHKLSVNPFQYSAEALDASSQRLSIDRRRWSHLFPVLYHFQEHKPSGDLLNSSTSGKKMLHIGPNWKSLVTPAILPLTTDYFPSPKELRDSYAESFYTLTLPSTSPFDSVPKYNNHDELLIEMICQRLACDFQLVTGNESANDSDAGSRVRQAVSVNGAAGFGGGGRYSTRQLDQAPDSHTVVYHLSTGHRIHQLIYDPERQTIEVKQYFQRSAAPRELATTTAPTSPPQVESVPYRYSIWVDTTQSFHPLQQEFHRFPTYDENWNSTDHLLCGYHDHMSDRSKCRRIRFAILPPELPSDERGGEVKAIAATFAAKFARFLDYLQSRVAPNEDGSLETIAVALELDASGVHHRPVTVLPKGHNSHCYKVCCRTSSASTSSSGASSSSQTTTATGGLAPLSSSVSRVRSEDTRTEWVMLNLEDTLDITRTYHLDVRWLACSGIVTDEFVGAVKRKAKQAGLELRRIPEYSSVSFLQIHPLIAPVLLPLSPSKETALGESMSIGKGKSRVVRIVEALGFVLDDERIADANGIGYGLGIEREDAAAVPTTASNSANVSTSVAAPAPRFPRRSASFTTRMLLTKFRTRGYQQFLHRQLPVFVRVTHAGIVWVPSYEYEEKHDSARVAALFRSLSEQLEAL
jgi:hypothetical protein